ncbi:nuclear transport factor 2 family protein [Sphingobium sp.]|uniref:nuclear transport factor 2 family protein n=1 Tax=Sphingobium sp. TaxID=1912891 RepID=UPI0028BE0067|nr:nuclear transport factor 2 family protein [Sphingobium sp.]
MEKDEQYRDHLLIRSAAELYAIGADRRDKALWRQVLAEDCVIEGLGFAVEGREANLHSIDALGRMFRATVHRVHQVVATIDGDRAMGETYSTADHLLKEKDELLVWSIRYQDEWRREAAGWQFARRRLIVDWEETRAVARVGAA